MKLFVSALEYSANVHLKYLLRELVRRENVEVCGIFDESILDSAESQNLGGNDSSLRDSAKQNRGKPPIKKTQNAELATSYHSTTSCHSERSEESKNNLSLRADSQNLRGNPPIKKTQDLQSRLPRSHSLARNDESRKFCARGTSLCDTNSLAVMGFIDVLKKAKFFLDLRPKCLNLALTADKILLMDSSSFNIPLAKRIKKSDKNKQIIYYILPQVWAWKPWRAKAIEANCDKLAAILPFEVEQYKEKAEFVGHPLLDEIQYFRLGNSSLEVHSAESRAKNLVILSESEESKNNPFVILSEAKYLKDKNRDSSVATLPQNDKIKENAESSAESQDGLPRRFCESARNDEILDSSVATLPQNDKIKAENDNMGQIAESSPIFSFMPGSRFGEIKRIFPIFLQVKDALKAREKGAKFHLIIPQKFASQNLAQIYGDVSDFHISFDAHLSLFQSRFAFICSGTATLECALIGTPFVLGYKCRAFEAFIARCFLKIKFIGLANILYEKISPNEMFHTELIQGDLSARNLLNALDSADKDEFLCKSLALRKYLKNGASKAVAKMLYDL